MLPHPASTNLVYPPHHRGLCYEQRNNTIIQNPTTKSTKVPNLRHDPRASVCVIDMNPPRHVTIDGTVTFDEDHVLDDLVSLASRYAGAEAGTKMAENIAKVPHITLKLSIDSVRTFGKI